jgi:hypothetical protein
VGRAPTHMSKSNLLRMYNVKHARKLRFLSAPEPWTDLNDPSITYTAADGKVAFSVGTRAVEVVIGAPRAHLVVVARKYSVHLKFLQTTHADPKAQATANKLAGKRFAAFRRKFRARVDSEKNIDAFVAYEYRKRRYTRKSGGYEATGVSRAHAQKCTPRHFGIPIHTMEKEDVDMCEYLLDGSTIANVAATQEIFLHFMAYLITHLTKYQSTLSGNHPLKKMDMSKMFDPSPMISGAALRVCFGKLNEHKPLKCKCADVPKENRKRNVRGGLMAAGQCATCHGKGHYMDTGRNPVSLVRVLVDPAHSNYAGLQSKMDAVLPRLNQVHNLPILLAITSTRVNVAALGADNAVGGMYIDVTPQIEKCMDGVPPNLLYRKRTTVDSGPRVTDDHILAVVQKYIRQADGVSQWSDLSVQCLVPWNATKYPRYRVTINPYSRGARWCTYKNAEHNSNTIYFVLVPPRKNGDVAHMYASCWSGKCKGHWGKTCVRDKTGWVITPTDAAVVWPGMNVGHVISTPSVASAAQTVRAALYAGAPTRGPARSAVVAGVQPTFREMLQSDANYSRLLVSFEFFRLRKDDRNVEPVIMQAYQALNLVGS